MKNEPTDFNDFPADQMVFIPLGGSEQFGMNLNVYGYNGKWLAVDCGIGFADATYPGVDLLLPDPAFLEERGKDLLGIVITHVHEDHIGAVPYLWSRLKCPIYCTPFAATFLRRKNSEFEDTQGMVIHEIYPDQKLTIGPFGIGVIGVTHSTPSTISLTLETPKGLVVHGNEWNLDPTPQIDGVTNREAFKIAGRKGVLAYIGDSTNAPFSGRPPGEQAVQMGLEQVFRGAQGQIVVTIFASNVARIISVVKAAVACGRHVAVAGRSLHNILSVASEHAYLKSIPPMLDLEKADSLPANKIVYIVTGCQGQANAALARIARHDYRGIDLGKGDVVVFSSRAIPGNEMEINGVKSNLIAGGVTVVDDDNTESVIHASGHPYRDEIAEMIDWVKPEVLIPIHGSRLHLEAQADIARSKQVRTILVPENGSVIVLEAGNSRIVGKVETGILAIEPSRIVARNHTGLEERRKLQVSGALHITAVVNAAGKMLASLQISGIGLFDHGDPDDIKLLKDLEDELQDRMEDMVEEGHGKDRNFLAEELRIGARRVIHSALGFKPKTTVHIVMV
jgi:ribonuclease J